MFCAMRAQFFFYAVLVLAIKGNNSTAVSTTAATLRACPSHCACSVQEDQQIVVLQCAGQNLSIIPTSDASMDLVVKLDLSDNAVEVIPNNAFTQYPKVEKIDASKNQISTIELCAFFGVDFLQAVDLSENFITYIHPDTFSANSNLQVINLSNNPLTKLATNVPILNVPMITKLDISYCQLPPLTSEMFKGMSRLETLDISNNDLSYFPFKTLNGLDSLVDIKLDFNRWSCDDCNLVRILKALALRRTVVIGEDMIELSCVDGNDTSIAMYIDKDSEFCDEAILLDVTILVEDNVIITGNNETDLIVEEKLENMYDNLWIYLHHHSNLIQTLLMASCMLVAIVICAVLCIKCIMLRSDRMFNAQQEILTQNLQQAYSDEPDQKRGSMVPLLDSPTEEDSPAVSRGWDMTMQPGDRPLSLYEEYLMSRPNSDHLFFTIE